MSKVKFFFFSILAASFLLSACDPAEEEGKLTDNQQKNFEKLVGTEYFLSTISAKDNPVPENFNQREISLFLASASLIQGYYQDSQTKEICGTYSAQITWVSNDTVRLSNYRGGQSKCVVSNFYQIINNDLLKFNFTEDSVMISRNNGMWSAIFVTLDQ